MQEKTEKKNLRDDINHVIAEDNEHPSDPKVEIQVGKSMASRI